MSQDCYCYFKLKTAQSCKGFGFTKHVCTFRKILHIFRCYLYNIPAESLSNNINPQLHKPRRNTCHPTELENYPSQHQQSGAICQHTELHRLIPTSGPTSDLGKSCSIIGRCDAIRNHFAPQQQQQQHTFVWNALPDTDTPTCTMCPLALSGVLPI